jgi:hypothetical protein
MLYLNLSVALIQLWFLIWSVVNIIDGKMSGGVLRDWNLFSRSVNLSSAINTFIERKKNKVPISIEAFMTSVK